MTENTKHSDAELAQVVGLVESDGPVSPPTLLGLQHLDVSGRALAEIAKVSPPTISKWRHGRAEMPNETSVFLSFVLASLIDEREDELFVAAKASDDWKNTQGRRLATARLCLAAQEHINATVSADVIRLATHRFRHWWNDHCQSRVADAMADVPYGAKPVKRAG